MCGHRIGHRIRLKPLLSTDYTAARSIFSEVFDQKEDSTFARAWRQRIPEKSLGVYGAYTKLVGFILVEEGFYISYIAIHPSHQKLQLGTRLLQSVLRQCVSEQRNVTLNPVEETHVIEWYRNHGFVEELQREGEPNRTMNFHTYNTRSKKRAFGRLYDNDAT